MRVILIAGFGEERHVFEKIDPFVTTHDKIYISLWQILPAERVKNISVQSIAQHVVSAYNITKDDVVVGHSTGGWLASHVRKIAGCKVIHLASWTDPSKVATPVYDRHLIYFGVRIGLYPNRCVLAWLLATRYRNKPSRYIVKCIFERLLHGPRGNVLNQLALIFNPVDGEVPPPDLAIHGEEDKIVKPPDAPYLRVSGDHFALYTHAEEVGSAIRDFLDANQVKKTAV